MPGDAQFTNLSLSSYYYEYSQRYGSPQMGVTPVVVKSVEVSEDGKKVTLDLGEMVARKIYQLDFAALSAGDGSAMSHGMLCYTVQRLREE
ncbi:MAG: hypothetical protein L3J39_07150 [Verrucomicrobiales bacterium]|nr:hypothetical protein [Verrucomicrobiales bacterium]